jgi:virginiamycin B lyase
MTGYFSEGKMTNASRKSIVLTISISLVLVAACGLCVWLEVADLNAATTPVALTGIVSSDAEGPMEGVLVKAKRMGGTITISVVSDARGQYSFPADRLKPGDYALAVRARGYDVPKTTVTVGDKPTTADLKLNKVGGVFALAEQLSPAEWIMSAPAPPKPSISLSDCGSCHNLNVVFKSTYDVDGWMTTLVRMRNYERGATFSHPTTTPFRSGPTPRDEEFAQYLASINMSAKPWDFELKGFPRPKGKATKVIYTEFDMPRPDAEPHDALIDSDGMIWYTEFNQPIFGRLDPRTGETKEWDLPVTRPGVPVGSLNLAMDSQGNFWIARKYQAGVAKFDRKTEKITPYSLSGSDVNLRTLTTFVAVGGKDGSGTVCFDDTGNRRIYVLDPATGKITGHDAYPGMNLDPAGDEGAAAPGQERHSMYGVSASSKGLCYWSDLANRNIGEIDPATGKITLYPTPTPNSGPRRENITADDQIWFGENNLSVQKIAVFDTNTKQFKEWPGRPVDPYDAILDKSGHVWTGGEPTDFVSRLDPSSGEIVSYLLPNVNTDIRRVYVDNLTGPPSMLVGENHRAKIVLVQPLE